MTGWKRPAPLRERDYRRLAPQTVSFTPGNLVILFTDGMADACDMSRYDALIRMDVGQLASVILRDWSRGTDDVAVFASRSEPD